VASSANSGNSPVNQRIYDALTVLQHRGQDAAGIMTAELGALCVRKGSGLVRDVFQQHHMLELRGHVGIGHVRYPTAGCDSASEAQPFYVNAPYGICLAHNGNLTNAAELADVLTREERRHLNSESDSEVLLNVLASELQRVGTPRGHAGRHLCRHHRRVPALPGRLCRRGHGHRSRRAGVPRPQRHPAAHPWASDAPPAAPSTCWPRRTWRSTCSPSSWSATWRPVKRVHRRAGAAALAAVREHRAPHPCIFEYVYFAAPRLHHRQYLRVPRAHAHGGAAGGQDPPRATPNTQFDVGDPGADTSPHQRPADGAEAPYQVSRGFQQEPLYRPDLHHAGPGAARKSGAPQLNAIDLEFRGKNVLLVDDSIVRGTTSAQIIELAREAGARQGVLCPGLGGHIAGDVFAGEQEVSNR